MLIHFIHITTLWSEEHTLFAPLKGMENLRVWCHLLCCARGHVWVMLKKLLSISPRSVQPRVSAFGFCQGFILLWFYIIVLLVSRVLFFATRWTEAYQAPLSVEFSRQEYWSGLPFPPPGDLPDPGIAPGSPALAGGCFTIWATREAHILIANTYTRKCNNVLDILFSL